MAPVAIVGGKSFAIFKGGPGIVDAFVVMQVERPTFRLIVVVDLVVRPRSFDRLDSD